MRIVVLTLALLATTGAWAAPSKQAVLTHYADIVHANYMDSLEAARRLQQAVEVFVDAPGEATQRRARDAWLDARDVYGQTEAFRFYGGPIDDADGPEGQINAWPMDESFVDKVAHQPHSGLINNPDFAITRENIAAYNERGGEENVASGWHAIEFFLWGQDRSEYSPGSRSYTDFVDGQAPNADRRRAYLRAATGLLLDDLASVAAEWRPNVAGNYRASFVAGGKESLRKILVGLGSLSRGELAGERMEVALFSRDQEDEHSCFSDNTHRDIVANALGIQNVWLGVYHRFNGKVMTGPGLQHLVAAANPALASATSARIAASVAAAKAIHSPFDREILEDAGRARIQRTIDSLVAQSDQIVDVAEALGIKKLTLVEP